MADCRDLAWFSFETGLTKISSGSGVAILSRVYTSWAANELNWLERFKRGSLNSDPLELLFGTVSIRKSSFSVEGSWEVRVAAICFRGG